MWRSTRVTLKRNASSTCGASREASRSRQASRSGRLRISQSLRRFTLWSITPWILPLMVFM